MKRESYGFRFEMKTKAEDAEVLVYSAIDAEKWWGDETTPADFDKALKDARKKGCKNLTIRVNSPGGDVYSAVAMRSMLIGAGFENMTVSIEGLCASAATLFATLPGIRVTIAEGSEFMIHNPMTFVFGNAEEMEKTVSHLRKMEEQFHGLYRMKCGKDEEQIKNWMDDETWFTAKEAVEAGFCDELISAEPVAASVSERMMCAMRENFREIPETVLVTKERDEGDDVSTTGPVAGTGVENIAKEEKDDMDIENLSLEALRTGNPALLEQIQNEAVSAERARMEDIDALTLPGYEQMAADAKRDGTTAMDFQKKLVAAMRQKGCEFLRAREEETAKAEAVRGGASEDGNTDAEKSDETARRIADFAKAMSAEGEKNMF